MTLCLSSEESRPLTLDCESAPLCCHSPHHSLLHTDGLRTYFYQQSGSWKHLNMPSPLKMVFVNMSRRKNSILKSLAWRTRDSLSFSKRASLSWYTSPFPGRCPFVWKRWSSTCEAWLSLKLKLLWANETASIFNPRNLHGIQRSCGCH